FAADRLRIGSPYPTPTHPVTYPRTPGSRETCLRPTGLERDAHQRLRALVAEHPSSIHPGISLVIDPGTPQRPVAGDSRARHKEIPAGSRGIAFHLDMAVQAVMDRE